MAYIANKPVRFDRDYKVGEVIPESVIAPSMTRKLVEMGKILHIDLPQSGGAEETGGQQQDGPENAPDGDSGAGDINTQAEGESLENGPQGGAGGAGSTTAGEDADIPASGEFVCETCGRAFSSQQALAAHSRSHKD